MKNILSISALLVVLISMISTGTIIAQPPGGRPDPKDMVLREKQNLYKKVEDLSEDQVALIDGIYDEFGMSMEETMKEAREKRDREGMRTKMEALRTEKDGLMRDILNDAQWIIYDDMTAAKRKKMEESRQQRSEGEGNNVAPEE